MPTLLVLALALLASCAAREEVQPPPELPYPALSDNADCDAFDDPVLAERLDKRTNSVERWGNTATLLIDGEDAFLRRFENSKDADMILVKTFIYSDDEMGRLLADLLIERAKAGALVILQYDIKGSVNSLSELQEMLDAAAEDNWLGHKRIIEEMEDAGVVVVPTNMPRRARTLERYVEAQSGAEEGGIDLRWFYLFRERRHLTNFDHEKYWITGHRTDDGGMEIQAILGGMNLASEYAYGGTLQVDDGSGRGGWRDTDVEVRGPVVNDVVDRFFDVMELNFDAPNVVDRETWNPPQPEVGAARIRFVWNQPAIGNDRSVERLYRTLTEATPEGGIVRISVAYFAPSPWFTRSLDRALRRDRRLAIVTNSEDSLDFAIISAATRYSYRQLLRTSDQAALYEWNHLPEQGLATLHSKVASFGRCGPVIVGSANLDGQSSEHNSESVVAIRDPDFRAQFDAMFEADLADGKVERISLQEVESTPLRIRARQWGIYRFGWYWLGG